MRLHWKGINQKEKGKEQTKIKGQIERAKKKWKREKIMRKRISGKRRLEKER